MPEHCVPWHEFACERGQARAHTLQIHPKAHATRSTTRQRPGLLVNVLAVTLVARVSGVFLAAATAEQRACCIYPADVCIQSQFIAFFKCSSIISDLNRAQTRRCLHAGAHWCQRPDGTAQPCPARIMRSKRPDTRLRALLRACVRCAGFASPQRPPRPCRHCCPLTAQSAAMHCAGGLAPGIKCYFTIHTSIKVVAWAVKTSQRTPAATLCAGRARSWLGPERTASPRTACLETLKT